jgi:vitamin B12 transporter
LFFNSTFIMDDPQLQNPRVMLFLSAFFVAASIVSNGISQGTTPSALKDPQPESVVVTVSADTVPLTEVSASVTIIGRDEIESSQVTTVFDLLQHTPFLHASQAGARGGLTTVSIRGGDPNFTLILLDGIPVNDPTNLLGGSFDLATLHLDNVERIEIVRGPISSRHGSEAIGGAINIISRKGEGPSNTLLHVQGGNFRNWEVGARTSGSFGAWHYAAAVSHFEIGEQVDSDDFESTHLSVKSGASPSDTTSIDLVFHLHDRTTSGFPPNGGGPEFSLLKDPKNSDVQEGLVGLTWHHQISPAWFYRINFDYYDRLENSQTPAILDAMPPTAAAQPPLDSKSDFERTRVTFTNVWDLGLGFQAGTDISLKYETADVETLIAKQYPAPFSLDRHTWSGGGELRFAKGRYQFDAGFRVDNSDDAAYEVSPRLGGSLRLGNRGTRIKTSWGEGFKLPSFFALGEPNVGNPNLRPETSKGFDLGLEQPLKGLRSLISISYFNNTFKNLIDFSPELFRLINRLEVTSRGIELGVNGTLSDFLQVGGHAAYVDTEITGTTEPLRDRPRWKGGLHLDWRPHYRLRINFRNTWIGERSDFQVPVPERNRASGYNTSSLGTTYQASEGVSLFVRIDNLFNSKFHQFVGFPDPGLYARFGLRYRLLLH